MDNIETFSPSGGGGSESNLLVDVGANVVDVGASFEENTYSKCGYCSGTKNFSHGMYCWRMPASLYECVLCCGWRRCGTYYYRHNNQFSCCKMYPIRLSVMEFQISRHQKKTVRRMNSFLSGVRGRTDSTGYSPLRLKFVMKKAEVTREAFQLYKKYQMNVHHDKESKLSLAGYTRFLCGNGLLPDPRESNNNNSRSNRDSFRVNEEDFNLTVWGQYHLEYRLVESSEGVGGGSSSSPAAFKGDGLLIGVSVIDKLPNGWSSVYFFYDTDHSDLSLGTYSALVEIDILRNCVVAASITKPMYYYMGFFIADCVKMRYKGRFYPSSIRNDDGEWVRLERDELDRNEKLPTGFSRAAEARNENNRNDGNDNDKRKKKKKRSEDSSDDEENPMNTTFALSFCDTYTSKIEDSIERKRLASSIDDLVLSVPILVQSPDKTIPFGAFKLFGLSLDPIFLKFVENELRHWVYSVGSEFTVRNLRYRLDYAMKSWDETYSKANLGWIGIVEDGKQQDDWVDDDEEEFLKELEGDIG